MSSGFYKLDDGGTALLYAPNFVWGKDFSLDRKTATARMEPVDGWKFFDTLEGACTYHKVGVAEQEQLLKADLPPERQATIETSVREQLATAEQELQAAAAKVDKLRALLR